MNEYKPLPQPIEQSKPIGYPTSRLFLAIIFGVIIGITIMSLLSVTNEELSIASIQSFDYGVEYTIAFIINQSIQCNQIPINYSGYDFTLYPLECLNLNQEGGK